MLDKILETNYYVSANSKCVNLNMDNINKLFDKYNFQNIQHLLMSNPFEILDLEIKDIVNFLVIYDSIDCSFWGSPKWEIESSKGKIDGAFALMYSLLELRKKYNGLNFDAISYEEFSNYLKGNVEIPLLKERYNVVKEVSNIINSKMNGDFYNYTKHITNDLDLFNLIINEFPSFKDERSYQEKTIYFYKLAQLLVSDILHIREIKEEIKVDYSHLIGCADYKIPQVLRSLGILEYNDELANLVDNKQEIKENSIYEVEIRANMIVALSEIKKLLTDVFMIDINNFVWSLGQDKSSPTKPYHLTRTMSY